MDSNNSKEAINNDDNVKIHDNSNGTPTTTTTTIEKVIKDKPIIQRATFSVDKTKMNNVNRIINQAKHKILLDTKNEKENDEDDPNDEDFEVASLNKKKRSNKKKILMYLKNL